MIDISKQPTIVSAINAVLNNGGTAQVKYEIGHGDKIDRLVVVEVNRKLKIAVNAEPFIEVHR